MLEPLPSPHRGKPFIGPHMHANGHFEHVRNALYYWCLRVGVHIPVCERPRNRTIPINMAMFVVAK